MEVRRRHVVVGVEVWTSAVSVATGRRVDMDRWAGCWCGMVEACSSSFGGALQTRRREGMEVGRSGALAARCRRTDAEVFT